MAMLDWPLCRTHLNGSAAQSGLHRFLRTALTEEKRRPVLDPEGPCFLTPLPPKDELLRARSVVGSVRTSESLVLYVFELFLFFFLRYRHIAYVNYFIELFLVTIAFVVVALTLFGGEGAVPHSC
jgi:hypothetical protein